jgi:hypothetical protein
MCMRVLSGESQLPLHENTLNMFHLFWVSLQKFQAKHTSKGKWQTESQTETQLWLICSDNLHKIFWGFCSKRLSGEILCKKRKKYRVYFETILISLSVWGSVWHYASTFGATQEKETSKKVSGSFCNSPQLCLRLGFCLSLCFDVTAFGRAGLLILQPLPDRSVVLWRSLVLISHSRYSKKNSGICQKYRIAYLCLVLAPTKNSKPKPKPKPSEQTPLRKYTYMYLRPDMHTYNTSMHT